MNMTKRARSHLSNPGAAPRNATKKSKAATKLRLESLEQRLLLHAGHGDVDHDSQFQGQVTDNSYFEQWMVDHPEYFDVVEEGESQDIIWPHHADPGHGGTPDTHFFAETGDTHHFAWNDQDPSTPAVVDIFYDFRALNGFANQITPGQIRMAELAMAFWEVATQGGVNFVRDTAAARANIIIIGTGDLAALGGASGPGGILGLGGGVFTHNNPLVHTITSGSAWMDFAETWDESYANGNPGGTIDYWSVATHEVGHAIGMGHVDDLPGSHIMRGFYSVELTNLTSQDVDHIRSPYPTGTPPVEPVFIADGLSNRIFGLDPQSEALFLSYDTPANATGSTVGLAQIGNRLFYSVTGGGGTVFELNATTGAVIDSDTFASLGLPTPIDGLAAISGALYAQHESTDTIFVIDPGTDSIINSFPAAQGIEGGLTGSGNRGSLFATDSATGVVRELTTGGAVIQSIATTLPSAHGAGFAGASLYVGSSPTGDMVEIDPNTGTVIDQFNVGLAINAMAADPAVTELIVTTTSPSGVTPAPVSSISITFSIDLDPTTFTTSDVTIVSPKGAVILPSSIVQLTPTSFAVLFTSQSAPGTYTYTIGPSITATTGAQMNQNQNATQGEVGVAPAGDQFQSSFTIPLDDTNVFSHPAAANNPVIAVNPFDSNFLVTAYEDWSTPNAAGTSFGNIPPFVGSLPRIGVSISSNHGLDWQHLNLPFPAAPAGLVAASNPSLAYDSAGRLTLLVGLSEGQAINPTGPADKFSQVNGLFVYTSSDNGQTWSAPVQIDMTGVACGAAQCFDDQAYLTTDFRSTSRIGGSSFANNLYAVWTRSYPDGEFPGNPASIGGGDIFIAQSTDFGATWSAPLQLTGSAQQPSNVPTNFTGTSTVQGPEAATGPNGDVYVAYQVGTRTAMQRLTHDTLGNLQLSGGPTNPFGTGSVSSVGAVLPNESFRANAFANIEIAPDPLVPGRTNVYVVATNDPDGVGIGTDGGDIRFARSIDGGQTWAAPIKVNTDATGKNQFFPWMATDERGNISIIWYDARNDVANRNLQVFARSSTDGGLTFGTELSPPLGAVPFDPNVGFPTTEVPGRLGDRISLAARRGEAFAVWTTSNPLAPLPPNQQDLLYESFLIGPAPAVSGPIVTATAPRDIFFSTEDLNGNGVLDAGEDVNPNSQIDVNALPISGVSPTITEISVEFSRALDEVSAEDERNYDLRRTGPDGVFDTADDIQYHLTPTYSPAAIDLADASKIGRSSVRLAIDFAANPLTAGESRLSAANYRLSVEGSSSVVGNNDIRLNAGRDKVMYFKVVDVPSFPTTSCETGAVCPSPFTPRVAEPNGTLATSIPIRLREGAEHTARGRIGTASDVDIYRVDLHVGDSLIVDVDAQDTLGSTLDSRVHIFDSAGLPSVTAACAAPNCNDSGVDPDSGVFGADAVLNFIAPATGTYFIAISSTGTIYDPVTGTVSTPGSAVGATPVYDLQVRVAPVYDSAAANNDTIALATSVRLRPGVENVLRASLGDNLALGNLADDVDLYRVSLNFQDRLDLTVDALFASLVNPADTVLRIFDFAGAELMINSAAGDPNLVFLVPSTGTYFIGVSAKPNTMYNPLIGGTTTSGVGASLGQYDLRIEQRPLSNQVPAPVYARADFVGASTGVYTSPFSTIQEAINTASATPGRQIIILGNANDAPFVVNPSDTNPNRRTFNLNSVNTLSIQNGTIIKFFNSTADIQGVGTLLSQGTFSDPVILTSLRDDLRGGDTNGDAGTTVPLREDWAGVRFLSTSNSLGSVINSTEFRYGGGLVTALGRRFSPIHIDSDLDLIANAAVTSTTRPTITNNLIVDSGEAAISVHLLDMAGAGPGGQQGPRIQGNQIERSSINGLFLRVGTDPGTGQFRQLTGTMRLDDTTINHVLTDNLDIVGGHLILDPGIVLKMRNNQIRMRNATSARFTSTGGTVTSVKDDEAGAGATAVGERQFDANNDGIHTAATDPQRAQTADWGGLIFEAGSSGCIIDSAQNITNAVTSNQTSCPTGLTPFGAALPAIPSVVAYGGGTVPGFSGGFSTVNVIEITGTPTSTPPRPTFVNIRNSIIHDNRGDAIVVNDGEVNFTGNLILDTTAGGAGIGAAINVDANTMDTVLFTTPRDPMIKGNRIENNVFNGLYIRGSTLGRDGVWNDTDITHIIDGTIDLGGAGGSVLLTVRDGVVVKAQPGASILVNGSGTGQTGGASSGLRVLGTAFSEDTNGNYRLDAAEDQATFATANGTLDRGPVVLTSILDDASLVRGFTVGQDGMPGLAGVDDDMINGIDDPGELGVGDDASFLQADASNNGQSFASPGDWQGITFGAFSNDGVRSFGTTIMPDNTAGSNANNSVVGVQLAPNSNGRTVLQSTGGFLPLAGGSPTVAASRVISTNATVTNDDLQFTAVAVGLAGNNIQVQYVVAGLNTTLSVATAGTNITFNLATDGAGNSITTGQDLLNLLARGNKVDHADIRFAVDGITAINQPRHSTFLADFVDPEGPAGAGPAQPRSPSAGVTNGGLPAIGNLGTWCDNNMDPSFQTAVRTGTCNGAPTNFNSSITVTGWISDANDVDFYSFTADQGSQIWVDIDYGMRPPTSAFDALVALYRISLDQSGNRSIDMIAVGDDTDTNPDTNNGTNGTQAFDTLIGPFILPGSLPRVFDVRGTSDRLYFIAVAGTGNNPDELCNPGTPPGPSADTLAALRDSGFSTTLDAGQAVSDQTGFDIPPGTAGFCGLGSGANTGQYQLEIRLATTLNPDPTTTLLDVIRPQGKLNISNSTFSNNTNSGVRQIPSDPITQPDATNAMPTPGPVRNLPGGGTNNSLYPGINIFNNVFLNNGGFGVSIAGQSAAAILGLPNTPQPFALLLNNSFSQNGTAIDVRDRAAPTILNNIVANGTNGIMVDGTSTGSTVIGHNLFFGNTADGSTGNNPTLGQDPRFVNPGSDLRLTTGSTAIDQSLSNLADRLQTARLSLDPFDTVNVPRDPTNLERSTPEPTFGMERNNASGQITDHDNLDRVDDPSTPNIGVGLDPYIDIGAYDLHDVKPPIVRLFTLARLDDTGEINETAPFLTRKRIPTFLGFVTDDSNDVDGTPLQNGLLVQIDVDGDGFDDGSGLTRLLRDPAGNPISFNNTGLLVGEFLVTSSVPIADTASQTVRVRVFDRNLNVSLVKSFTIGVDTVAPLATGAATNSNTSPTMVSVTYTEPILLEDNFLRAYWQFESEPASRPFPGSAITDSSLRLNHGTSSGDVFAVSSLLATGATLITNGSADDSLIFRAVELGPTGGTIRIQMVSGAATSVTVTDSDITITFAVGTTAAALANFLQTSPTADAVAARALISAAIAPGGTGSGVVGPVALQRLAQNTIHAVGSRTVAEFRGPFNNAGLATPPRPVISTPDNVDGSLDLTGEFTLSAWVSLRDHGASPNFTDSRRRPILAKHTAGSADGGWVLAIEDVLTGLAGLTTKSPTPNANLTFRAVEAGTAGSAVTIEYLPGNALGVAVVNKAVTITFIPGSSTAQDILNAVRSSSIARTLINVDKAPNNDGTGVLNSTDTFAPQNLARGDSLVFDFFPTTGGLQRIQSSGRIPIEDWTHVALTYNPATTEWRMYLNGQLDNFGSGTELTIDQAGGNNALLFTAQTPNVGVNSTRINLVAAASLSVSVTGNDITVNFISGATSAQQVRDAINNNVLASALVRASLAPTDNVSGTNNGSGAILATGGFRPLAFAFPASAATNSAPVLIGAEAGVAASFDGFLDEVQIRARDLSSEDIERSRARELPPTIQIIAANQNAFDLQSDADFFNDGNEVTIQITSLSVTGNVVTLTVADPREIAAPFGLQSDRYQVNIFGNFGTTDLAGNPVLPATLLFAVDSVPPVFLDFELDPTLSDTGLKFSLDQEYGQFTTNLAGANNDLRFTAVTPGPAGNAIQFEYIAAAADAVSVSGNRITINFVAGATRAIDVLNLVNGELAASALVTASLPAGNNGTGLVAAQALTNLVVRAKTNQNRPFFSGQVTDQFPGSPDGMTVLLDIDGAGTFNAGTPNTRTAGGGFFTIQSIVALSEGIHTVTARITDLAGNSTESTISIEVDLTAPVLTRTCVVDVSDGLCKVGLLADRASSLRFAPSERLFDLAGDGNRISGNLNHYTLTGQIQGSVAALLTAVSYSYAIPASSSFTAVDSPGGEIRVTFGTLRPDTYTFRADATTGATPTTIMDEAGNLLDGDFPGPGPFPFQQNFPTGDGNLNDDDFVWGPPLGGFIVPDVIPPRVTLVTILPTRQVVVQFDEAMNPASFTAARVLLQRDGTPSGDNAFDVTAGTTFSFATTVFANDTLIMTVNAGESLPTDLYRVLLISNPTGISDPVGNRLDGECFNGVTNCVFPSGNGIVGGDFEFRYNFAREFFADASVAVSGSGSRGNPFRTIQQALNAAASAPIKFDQILVTALGSGAPGTPTAAFVIPADNRLDVPAGLTLRFLPEVRGTGPGPFAAAPVVVKLDRALIDLGSFNPIGLSSQLSIEGTATHRVLFTSIHDDTGVDGIAGTADDSDTNGNSNATVPAKEDWAGLLLRSPADTSQSTIRFAEFRFGGGKFTHPLFGQVAVSPIQLVDARPDIRDNLFNHNAQAAITADLASFRTVGSRVGPLIGVNTYNDNSINGLLTLIQPGEQAANNITFDDADIVHVITQNLSLTGAPVTFAINAGVKVKLFNSVITVGAGSTLRVVGTANSPVVITSVRDDSVGAGLNLLGTTQTDTNNDSTATTRAAGNYGGIEFLGGSFGTLEKVDIGFGGGNVPVPAGTPRPVNLIDIQTGALVEIRSSDIHDMLGPAIFVTSTAPTIFNNLIRNAIADPNNPGRVPSAISVTPDVLGVGPDDPNLVTHGFNAFIRNNLISNSLLQDPLNPMINGLEIRGGTLGSPGLWDDSDITHVLRGQLQIAPPIGRLFVLPGVTVKLLGGTAGIDLQSDLAFSGPSLTIGFNDTNPATVEPRTIFTSLRDDAVIVRGTWLGFDGVAGDTTLFSTDFETGAAGFTPTGLWGLSTSRGSAPGHSATTSFYYGRDGDGNPATPGSYATAGANTGTLTRAPINLGGIRTPVTMTFNYFLQTDALGDVAEVLARRDAASQFQVIGTLANTATNFVSQTFDLSTFASATTQIQFRFTADGVNDFLEGFFVDDIRVFSGGDQAFSMANADNDLTQPAPADWNGIRFNPFTNEQASIGSRIRNSDFKFANNAVTIAGLPQTGPFVSGVPTDPQGVFFIRDSLFATNVNGIVVISGAPLGGAQRLVPGARLENNVFVGQIAAGLSITGAAPGEPIQVVEVINNTFHRNDVGLDIRTNSGPTVLSNIFSQQATAGVRIDASSDALRSSGNGPILDSNLYATGALFNTVDIVVTGTPTAPGLVDSRPVFGSPGYVNVSAAYNANVAFGRDFELTRGSAAVDSARSDLPARFGTASLLAPTNDQREGFRIDAPGFPNVGTGTTPFFDVGASELVDFISPFVPSATLRLVPAPLSPLGDTGIQNDSPIPKTNQTRPGFEGFVSDNSGDLIGLQVCLDVDGIDTAPVSNPLNPFDDGCGVTGAGGFFRFATTTAISTTASRQVNVRATDRAGNTGVNSLLIAVDLVAPTVLSIGPVTSPRNTTVTTVDVTFSERIIVDTLDSRDLTLRLNGGPNLLGGAAPVTITFVSGNTYQISGLGGLTGPNGTYVLTLAGAGVLDEAGNAGSGTPSVTWIMDTTPPIPPVISAISTDTGLGTTDAVTNDTTLILSGTAEPLSTVALTQVGVGVIGSAVTTAGGTWSIGAPAGITFSQGTFDFTATATDPATNVSPPSLVFTVTVDTTSPGAPSTPDLDAASDTFGPTGTNNDNITSDTTPTFTGTAEALGRVSVFAGPTLLGTAPVTAVGTWTFTSGMLAPGNYSITATVTDVAGNVSSSSGALTVTIDISTPTPSAPDLLASSDSFGPNGTSSDDITNDTTPTFSGTVEANASIEIFSSITGSLGTTVADASGLWFFTSGAIPQGIHNITARATDPAGNVSLISTALAITVDIFVAAPSTPDLDPSSDFGPSTTDNITNDNTPTFNGTAEPNSTVQVFSNVNGLLGTTTTSAVGNWTLTSVVNLTDGTHSITAQATDVAGNISPFSSALAPLIIDTVPPSTPPSTPDLCSLVSAVCPEASDTFGPDGTNTDNITRDNTPTFTGTAEANGTVRFFDGLVTLGVTVVNGAGIWTFTSGVLADGVHVITATVTDVAGNETAQSSAIFVTIDTQIATPSIPNLDTGSDTFGPNGTNIDNITLDNTPLFTGTGEPASRVSLFSSITGLLGSTVVDGSGNWSFGPVTIPLADGVHVFTASAIDVAGNQSAVSAGLSVTIDSVGIPPSQPDMTPATDTFGANPPTGSNADNVTRNMTPTFTGTSEPNSFVELFSDVDGRVGTISADASGLWTITSSALTAGASPTGTQHNMTARLTDVAGNMSIASVAILVRIDVTATPPAIPDLDPSSDLGSSNLDNVTNDTTPTFNGASFSAEPLSNLTLFDGGVTLGTVPVNAVGAWTFTVTAPPLGEGVHTISGQVTDLAGNVSGFSTALSMTVDTTAPAAPSQPDLVTASDSGSINTDNLTNVRRSTFSGIAEPLSTVSLTSNMDGPNGSAQANAAGAWTVTSTVDLAEGSHVINARATDLAGNLGPQGPGLTIVIDTTPPAGPPDVNLVSTVTNDTGLSQTDNITSQIRPAFNGANAEVGTLLTLFAGVTQLGTFTIPANRVWNITSPTLTDGSYVITATQTDPAGNVSLPTRLDNNPNSFLVIDTTAPPAPAPPNVSPNSDSFGSNGTNSDDTTNDTTPTFTYDIGGAEARARITFFDGASVLGFDDPEPDDATGVWNFTVPAGLAMSQGVHQITAKATDRAGNLSGFSTALALTIDTQTASPVIQSISTDTGRMANDGVTSDASLVFTGQAEALSRVTILRGGVFFGTTDADLSGAWTFIAPLLGSGTFNITAQATDVAGNTSAVSSPAFGVTIDQAAPTIGAALTLLLGDDTGVQGDNITTRRRPRLTGVTEPGEFVDIFDTFGNVLGSATADPTTGQYVVSFNSDLPDGIYNATVRASDLAGNRSPEIPITFTVDGTAPQVLGVTPTGTQIVNVAQIIVQFNNDDLNSRTEGDPAFAGSVLSRTNYTLRGAGGDGNFANGNERTISLTTSQFLYSPALDQLTINVRDAAGNPLQLTNDSYRLVILGTTSVQDIAGNPIAGGDFTHNFVVAVPPPIIENIRLTGTTKVVTQIFLTFSRTLQLGPATNPQLGPATNPSNYRLVGPGRDRLFDTLDDVEIDLLTPRLDATNKIVTLDFNRGISQKAAFFRLFVDGTPAGGVNDALRDSSGNLLDGNFDGVAGGDHFSFISRARSFSYFDSTGDSVTISVAGGGFAELVRYANGEGRFLNLTGTKPGKTSLNGTVAAGAGGDGVTEFDTITGTNGVSLLNFRQPPFVINNPPIRAVVAERALEVDEVLDAGESAGSILADVIASGMRRRK